MFSFFNVSEELKMERNFTTMKIGDESSSSISSFTDMSSGFNQEVQKLLDIIDPPF
jgi:hypothetical protein